MSKITLDKQEIENCYNDMKAKTCCFSGHRPQKLPWGFNEKDIRCVEMKDKLRFEIEKSIEQGYTHFISGMAIGFDMIVAEIVIDIKEKYKDIKLICALPCKDQYKIWNNDYQKRYKNILRKADTIRCLYKKYNEKCMLERNLYMLNNSSKLIVLYNHLGGGTSYTIQKAKDLNLDIRYIGI